MIKHTTGITVGDWLKGATKQLGKSPTANLDARLLMAHVLEWDQSKVLAHPETLLGPQQIHQLERAFKQRKVGVPVAYITGYKDFADFRVKVNEHVLIPRPETEAVLAEAIEIARSLLSSRAKSRDLTIYEIGTGSGVIAIGLARALPDAKIIASDISPEALAVAKQNVIDAKLDGRIICSLSDLGRHIQHAELIVANLPYLPTGLKVSRDIKQEPSVALWSGKDGLDHYRKLFSSVSFETAVIEFGAKQFTPLTKWLTHNLSGFTMEPISDLGGNICGGVIRANQIDA